MSKPEKTLVMSVLMTSDMANFGGNVHGGKILSLLDNVAYACASRYSKRYVVTLSVDQMFFKEPIHVGDLVTSWRRSTTPVVPRWRSVSVWKLSTSAVACGDTPTPVISPWWPWVKTVSPLKFPSWGSRLMKTASGTGQPNYVGVSENRMRPEVANAMCLNPHE